MKLRFLKNPKTGVPDLMTTLTTITVLVATLKFLLDGVTLTLKGHTLDFGHLDSMTYGMFLAPILGTHGWVETKTTKETNGNSN